MKRFIVIFILFLSAFGILNEAQAKICRKGIPCGNSCISATKTCRVGRGSAVHISEIAATKRVESTEFGSIKNHGRKVTEENDAKNSGSNKFSEGTLRSTGINFFIVDSGSKSFKCEYMYCVGISSVEKGQKLKFLDGGNLVEFKSYSGIEACDVVGCRELVR